MADGGERHWPPPRVRLARDRDAPHIRARWKCGSTYWRGVESSEPPCVTKPTALSASSRVDRADGTQVCSYRSIPAPSAAIRPSIVGRQARPL